MPGSGAGAGSASIVRPVSTWNCCETTSLVCTARGELAMTTALEWGRAYWNAGLSVIPIRGDGSKEPELPAGDDVLNRRRRATLVEIESWLSGPWQGVGVLGGPVSGGLEVIDFDRADLFPPWSAMIQVE